MNGWDKLDYAHYLIQKQILEQIIQTKREDHRLVIHFKMKNGIDFYVRYNDFGEYSYQIVFSQKSLDRIRFDNYDAHWDVRTKPHHVHLRFKSVGSESKMNGTPQHDIPLLINEMQEFF